MYLYGMIVDGASSTDLQHVIRSAGYFLFRIIGYKIIAHEESIAATVGTVSVQNVSCDVLIG